MLNTNILLYIKYKFLLMNGFTIFYSKFKYLIIKLKKVNNNYSKF